MGIITWAHDTNYVPNRNPFITPPKIYIGEFYNDLVTGKGKLKYMNGFTYIGHFENGMKNGYGLYFNRKFHFIGDWQNNDFKKGFIYKRVQSLTEHGIPTYFTQAFYLDNRGIHTASLETHFVFDLDRIEYYV
jgi:hypothetical protein